MADTTKVMRYMLQEFYGVPGEDGSVTYHYMNKGFTQLDETGEAEVEDGEAYIGDKNATPSINGYNGSWEFETQYIYGDPVCDDIREIGIRQYTGSECERDMISIDLMHPAASGSEGEYEARRIRIAVETTAPHGEPRSVTIMNGTMHQLGDAEHGTFNVTTKTFTAGV